MIFHGGYPYDIGIKFIGFQYAYPQDSGETSMKRLVKICGSARDLVDANEIRGEGCRFCGRRFVRCCFVVLSGDTFTNPFLFIPVVLSSDCLKLLEAC